MVFGQSIFQSVLNRLADEADEIEADATTPGAYTLRGFGSSFVADTSKSDTAGNDGEQMTGTRSSAYREVADDLMPPEEDNADATAPVMPPQLGRLSVAEILEDLRLGPNETTAELSEKRRAFARDNHPDRVPSQFRHQATTRMKIANLLIDEAMRRAR